MATQSKKKISRKKWTILIWMAGDNDLESAGDDDLAEIKAVGSTDHVNVVVQFDRMSDDKTRRYYLRKGTSLASDEVGSLGETNSGDPDVAVDFFSWGIATYPADRIVAVFWNHGSGIDETNVYRMIGRPQALSFLRKGGKQRDKTSRRTANRVASGRFRKALFQSTVETAVKPSETARAILYDDTNRDFLDNVELQRVLARVKKAAARRIDVVGFDACLMNMIELGFQIRKSADFMVGSEELEPAAGWPYTTILKLLNKKPDMSPSELGAAVVDLYARSYRDVNVTQSLFELKGADAVGAAVDRLAQALLAALKKPDEYMVIDKARRRVQSFDTKDFVDLYDLCDLLAARSQDPAVIAAARAVCSALEIGAGFIAAEAHKGAQVQRARGAAIYFPKAGDVAVAYDRMDFAKKTRWGRFVAAYTRG